MGRKKGKREEVYREGYEGKKRMRKEMERMCMGEEIKEDKKK